VDIQGQAGVTISPPPPELRSLDRWIVYRLVDVRGKSKPTKVPYTARQDRKRGWRCSVSNPENFTSYEVALDMLRTGHKGGSFDGLGFVLFPLVGIDLDDCRDPVTGVLTPEAAEIVREMDTYTEISPTGTGLHLIGHGYVPRHGNVNKQENSSVEMYSEGRYFTFTGNRLPGTPNSVEERFRQISKLHKQYFPEGYREPPLPSEKPIANPNGRRTAIGLEDELVLERATKRYGDTFEALLQGDRSGYKTQSEGDMAFLRYLSGVTNNPSQMTRIMRASGLFRARKGTEYLEKSIAKVLSSRVTLKPITVDPALTRFFERHRVSTATISAFEYVLWQNRYWADKGLIRLPSVVLKELPDGMPSSLVRVYDGFGYLLQLQSVLGHAGKPIMYSHRFAHQWTDVSKARCADAIVWLCDHGYLRVVDQVPSGSFRFTPKYLPGSGKRRRKSGSFLGLE
jgi:hypothetical protein